ncbi:hypothetical protein CEXT_495271 [Caerostris extrusa]|uniref:Uncharacterized protein n=1 Tax=Caerostris extrusa TaxID=172846 RepID=A0AAV4PEI3_CAEEX|nr:hypothetical protein CEXT_495271 [Caerostris extrusa]
MSYDRWQHDRTWSRGRAGESEQEAFARRCRQEADGVLRAESQDLPLHRRPPDETEITEDVQEGGSSDRLNKKLSSKQRSLNVAWSVPCLCQAYGC